MGLAGNRRMTDRRNQKAELEASELESRLKGDFYRFTGTSHTLPRVKGVTQGAGICVGVDVVVTEGVNDAIGGLNKA